MASGVKTPKPVMQKIARNYRHPESEGPMRPEIGMQAQVNNELPLRDVLTLVHQIVMANCTTRIGMSARRMAPVPVGRIFRCLERSQDDDVAMW